MNGVELAGLIRREVPRLPYSSDIELALDQRIVIDSPGCSFGASATRYWGLS